MKKKRSFWFDVKSYFCYIWFVRFQQKLELEIGMKTTNCLSFTLYGILLLLFAMISYSQSKPFERYEGREGHVGHEEHEGHESHERYPHHPFNVQNAAIFDAPKIAKERCDGGMIWIDGKCRTSID